MKRCISLCLACIVFVTLLSNRAFALNSPYSPPVSAQESLSVGDHYVVEKKYGDREEVTVLKTEETEVETIPDGQPEYGYCFPSYGGSVLVSKTGGPSVDVSISVSWKIFSISIGSGFVTGRPSASTISVNFPPDNNYYRIKLVHTYRVEHKKIDRYIYNEYQDTAYVDDYTLVGIRPELEFTRAA